MNNFKLEVEWWPIEKIIPYEGNIKIHDNQQVEKLAKNIAETGFDVPISVDQNGVIISGHARRLSCLKLGLKDIPVIVRRDLSDAQIKIKRLTDNSLSISSYDELATRKEIDDLRELGVDLTLFGTSEQELLKLSSDIDEGLRKTKNLDHGEGKSVADPEVQLILTIRFNDEVTMKEKYEELINEGFDVKIFS